MPINRTWRVWGAAIALAFNVGAAGAQGVDVAKLIPDAAEVVSARIALMPPGLRFRVAPTETTLLTFGCHVSEDGKRIAALLDVLKSNLQNDDGDVSRFFVNNGVFLKLRSGATVKFTFGGAEHRNNRIHGWADNGKPSESMYFFSQAGLLTALERWAGNDLVEKKDGQWCVANR
ncbi:hypothetical protein C9I28_19235 [Pseudoduganella armeniaca]|uniref:Chalcone isomerase domain-containing protein n=2 Tax=Pseudoduganella armeniaca TaxID=2072590 RepID=A0A2R4CDJ6_9BURK|nr:hypothetical protein C9I28_19235 [Pseudoduganella armeniaca]